MRFKRSYTDLLSSWEKQHSWALLHELAPDDRYHLDDLDILISNSFSGIDRIALAISKTISDSINDGVLTNLLPDPETETEEKKDRPKISILQEYLNQEKYEDSQGYIKFLRDVQSLRSASAAHRKRRTSKNYLKILQRLCPDYKHLIQVADAIFVSLADFLDSLREHFCPDESD